MGILEDQIRAAEDADARNDWAAAAKLWSEIFHSNDVGYDWGRAGRRAALAYRKAGDFMSARQHLAPVIKQNPLDQYARRELARLERAMSRVNSRNAYWHQRRDYIYLKVVEQITVNIAGNANAVIDVGSKGTPVLEWFAAVPVRYSVDLRTPYRAPGIDAITTDFLKWSPTRRFDVGLCLQVLEHVPDPTAFSHKLINLCDVTIISVPYRWPETKTHVHLHDPVDEDKLRAWFDRDPNYMYKVKELFGEERLVCVYDAKTEKRWKSVDENNFRYRWSLKGSERVLGV